MVSEKREGDEADSGDHGACSMWGQEALELPQLDFLHNQVVSLQPLYLSLQYMCFGFQQPRG